MTTPEPNMDDFRRQQVEAERRRAEQEKLTAIHTKLDRRGMFGSLRARADTKSKDTDYVTDDSIHRMDKRIPVLKWPSHFLESIAVDAEKRREEFYEKMYPPIPDDKPADQEALGKNVMFTTAAGYVADAFHQVTHNAATEAVGKSRLGRAVRAIGKIPHYMRYPLGRPEQNLNGYTKVTVNADFYIQATGAAVFGGLFRQLAHGAAAASKAMFHQAHDTLEGAKQTHPWPSRLFRLSRLIWNWGGKQLTTALYHYVCCDKDSHGKHHFSPLQIANSAAFSLIVAGGVTIAPIAATPLILAASPFYWKMTEQTYTDMNVMDKSDEDQDGVFKLYVASAQEMTELKLARKAGADVEDDEIGRRFDIEEIPFYQIFNPNQIAGMIPKIGHCDQIKTTGIFFRTPRLKIGPMKLIRAHVWLSPIVRGTQGCASDRADASPAGTSLDFGTPQYFANLGTPTAPYGSAVTAHLKAPSTTLNLGG